MCTVSFIPVKGTVYLTSNRDEKSTRLQAEPPLLNKVSGSILLYPKDGDKGGTWIAVNKKGDAGVLLNGANLAHASELSYRYSRGLILPQILFDDDPLATFSAFDCIEIEPFTLVLYVQGGLYECRWDASLKSIHTLPANEPKIWSSSTLYTPEMQEKRRGWFKHWLKEHPSPDAESIFQFHRFGGEGDPAVDCVMNRDGEMKTASITALQLTGDKAVMNYHQLSNNRVYRNHLSFIQREASAVSLWWQRFLIRLWHWEYWPFHILYAPIYPYWFWLCLKARSLFFFTASNPTIRNGGFLMESKKEIYDLMPAGSFPTTMLVRKGDFETDVLQDILPKHHLSFPMVAKPDIGLRGLGVKLLRNGNDLAKYHQQSEVDYLLQAYVPYQNEVGIFYYRFPGHKQGAITGVVGKELLSVTGDGVKTVEQLLAKEKRFVLQLDALRKIEPVSLTRVLAAGETKLLVPYGNHSRGAKFIDRSEEVNQGLTKTIHALCLQIPGFYFGRLDIRYNHWAELCAGKNFSVIELNGAGSEPAHIYDPKHSIFFAWKEIIRHWNLLYHISKRNKQLKNLPYLSLKKGIDLFRENAAYMKKIS